MQLCHAVLIDSKPIAKDLHLLSLKVPLPILQEATPGQCAHVKVPGDPSRLLRRPMSMYSKERDLLHLAIQPKGEGTKHIVATKIGETLDILFPFGKGFVGKDAKRIWLVGGGVGVAPMRGCAEGFAGVERAYFGFRTKEHVYAVSECESAHCAVTICTDDGSLGVHGLVTKPLLEDLSTDRPDLIMACGPTPMLKALQSIAKQYDIPIQLSLEQRMGCGVGACLVCTCATTWGGNLRVCVDGPVFDGEVVQL